VTGETELSIAAEIRSPTYDSRRYRHNCVGDILKFPGNRGEDCEGGKPTVLPTMLQMIQKSTVR